MRKREFWNMVMLTAVPYSVVGILSALTTKPRPSFWIVHGVIIVCYILLFSFLWFKIYKERRNGK